MFCEPGCFQSFLAEFPALLPARFSGFGSGSGHHLSRTHLPFYGMALWLSLLNTLLSISRILSHSAEELLRHDPGIARVTLRSDSGPVDLFRGNYCSVGYLGDLLPEGTTQSFAIEKLF